MNSLTELLLRVLEESGTQCGIDTTQDRKTILSRVENEGFEFITLILPAFCKDFERSLSDGLVDSRLFPHFKRIRGEALPVFLGGFLGRIFDKETGRILDKSQRLEHAVIVRAVRQITGLMSKLEGACSLERENQAKLRFIENDSYVRLMDKKRSPELMGEFLTMAHVLFGYVFDRVQRDIKTDNIHPIHGPGVTADRLFGNEKFNPLLTTWPDSLETVFPKWRYGFSSGSLYLEAVESGAEWPGTEIPVKVVLVPKTPKSPRIIAIEPTARQYLQQGLFRSFEDAINSSRIGGIMSWSSQLPNQQLAKLGSIGFESENPIHDGLATLDLSDASDLVSNRLVLHMLRNYPLLRDAVEATRSEMASLDDKTIVLSKFASMGSALCFPIESIVFTTIVFLGLRKAYPQVPPKTLVRRFLGQVRVYGDDIIVPARAARSVVLYLEAFGLRVNKSKSFWSGYFRESCGEDFYAGISVSYTKCRHEFPNPQKAPSEQVREIASLVSLRNNLFLRGYHETAEWCDGTILKCLDGIFPYGNLSSSGLVRYSFDGFEVQKWDNELSMPLVKAWVVSSASPRSYGGDLGSLVKTLSKTSGFPNPDPQHLYRAGRPSSLRIKKRWVRPF